MNSYPRFFLKQRSDYAGFALLWLAGLYLRLTILAAPPVAPLIKADLNLGEAAVGMLTTLPTLLFAAVAIPGAFIIARLGARNTVIWGLLLTGAGSALRGAAVGAYSLYGATFLMGAGIAAMQPALPALVYHWYPQRIGFCTALYTNGLLVGEILSSGLTLPFVLPVVQNSWRLSFLFWSIPAVFVALAFHRRRNDNNGYEMPVRLWWPNWRDPNIWLLGLTLGGVSSLYFGTNAYLPSLLHSTGHPELISTALFILNGSQLISSISLLFLARTFVGRRLPLIVVSLSAAAAGAGLIFIEGAAAPVIFAGIIGLTTSFMLILILALPPLLGGEKRTASISAAMFTLTYLCAFVIPLLGGLVWDATKSAHMTFLPLVIFIVIGACLAAQLRIKQHAYKKG